MVGATGTAAVAVAVQPSKPARAPNTDEATYSPDTAGFLGLGDPPGSKQGTMKTYLSLGIFYARLWPVVAEET